MGSTEALKLAAHAEELYVSKGKTVVHVNLRKDKPSNQVIEKLMLGPTGNLRAPTIRKGKTILVGFNEEAYEKVLVKSK